jgi:hypothetical protein
MTLHIPDNSKIKISFSNGQQRKGILLSWDQDSILLRLKCGNDLIINNPDRNVVTIEVIGGGTTIQQDEEAPVTERNPKLIPQEESVESIEARHLEEAFEKRKAQIAEERRSWLTQATNPVASFQPIGNHYEPPTFKK